MLHMSENSTNVVLSDKNNEETNKIEDEEFHALLARINQDPVSYKVAMQTKEINEWQEAINDELNSLNKMKVWYIVDRPMMSSDGNKPNIIDSKWVFKRKIEKDGNIKFKSRLVIRGFKDRNTYDVCKRFTFVLSAIVR